MFRRLALTGMVALLVGAAAYAETPDPETPDAQTPEPAQDDSIEAVRTRENTGDAEAQVTLGLMYATGESMPQDFVEAYNMVEPRDDLCRRIDTRNVGQAA